MYYSKNCTSFYSTIGSSAQRLPNGNTLVCSMNDGHFFEVHPADTSIVWEYINPVTRDGIKKIKVDNYPTYNGVFRAYRYASTHPALAGHNLTPGNTITGSTPNYFIPADLVAIKENGSDMLPDDRLHQNYPNPFKISTTIEFELQESKQVNVVIFNSEGTKIKTLVNRSFAPGKYSLNWDGANESGVKMPTGMYYCILNANDQQMSKKMILIK